MTHFIQPPNTIIGDSRQAFDEHGNSVAPIDWSGRIVLSIDKNGNAVDRNGNIFAPAADLERPHNLAIINDFAILHVESTTGQYVEIKQHEDGTLYIKTNANLDKASKLFFDKVVKENISHGPYAVTQTNLNTKNNVDAVIETKP